jgi:hypothetical protein
MQGVLRLIRINAHSSGRAFFSKAPPVFALLLGLSNAELGAMHNLYVNIREVGQTYTK